MKVIKTDRIIADVGDGAIEMKLTRPLIYTESGWIDFITNNTNHEQVLTVYDGHTHHICPYCHQITLGTCKDELCPECKDLFGHSLIQEL